MSVSMLGPVSTLKRWREESLYLDFVSGDPIDSRITTVRGSEASYFDADGVLRFAPANTPRIDFDPVTGECKGLLVEESRTNLLANSGGFHLTPWATLPTVTITPNAVEGLDGKLSGTRIARTDAAYQFIRQSFSGVTAGATVTGYAIAKAGTHRALSMLLSGDGAATPHARVTFNLDTLTVANSSSVTLVASGVIPLAGGWNLCHVTATLPAVTNPQIYVYPGHYSAVGAGDIYLMHMQVEVGAFPTSVTPTPAVFQSRASVKTYTDAHGVLRTAGINEPAYDHGYVDGRWVSKGLSVEGAATNGLGKSVLLDYFASEGVQKVSTNAGAPDGTAAVTLIRETSTTSASPHNAQYIFTPEAAGPVTASFHLKYGGKRYCAVSFTGGGVGSNAPAVVVDMAEKKVASATGPLLAYTLEHLANDWIRVSISATLTVSVAAPRITLLNGPLFSGASYIGDGVAGVYAWGAQREPGTTCSSYVYTDVGAVTRAADVAPSAAVTRAADVVSMPTAGWYRQDEGTLVADGRSYAALSSPVSLVQVGDNERNRMRLIWWNNAERIRFAIDSNGISGTQTMPQITDATRNGIAAGAYGKNLYTLSFAGAVRGESEVAPPPLVDRVYLGSSITNFWLNGHLRRFAHYARRFSDAQLQQLTLR